MEYYEHNGQKLSVALRCFTSGVTTTDVSIFAEGRLGWELVLWYPVRKEGLTVVQQKDGLRVAGVDWPDTNEVTRLFLSYEALSARWPNQQVEPTADGASSSAPRATSRVGGGSP